MRKSLICLEIKLLQMLFNMFAENMLISAYVAKNFGRLKIVFIPFKCPIKMISKTLSIKA